jgi:uncharacterized protein YqjF (DUF2071 family)
MKVPVIEGVIRRRVLVNFRVEPEVMRAQMPAGLRPKLHHGWAIAGICFVRLEALRPRYLPAWLGVSSENAAHRVAVTWTQADGAPREGVFIPRRDTASLVARLAGGRLFPGEHRLARFAVHDHGERLDLSLRSDDGGVIVDVRGRPGGCLPVRSVFSSLAEASAFFRAGSIGYSVTSDPRRLDGIELRMRDWRMEPLQVEHAYSSYFADERRFPAGSVVFDCALVMRDLPHQWHAADRLRV